MTIILLIPFIYFVWLMILVQKWPVLQPEETVHTANAISVSLIVAVRNEEKNIPNILHDIYAQNYPTAFLEIIIVDDHSTDSTYSLLQTYDRIVVLRNAGEGKKAAITTGVHYSKATLIISTDADCRLSPSWISTMVSHQQHYNAAMVCGPVQLTPAGDMPDLKSELVYRMQQFEFHSLILMSGAYINMGKPMTCNGANIVYQRNLFLKVNGYQGNEHIASGDDEFLMTKLIEQGKIVMATSQQSIVKTKALKTFEQYQQQRIRWASKHSHYAEWYKKLTLVLVGITHVFTIFSLALLFYNPMIAVAYFAFKIAIEFLFISHIHQFLRIKTSLIYLILLQCIYPFVVIHIALKAKYLDYEWKGRKIKTH